MEPTLPDVESLARRAGAVILAGFGAHHHIQYKGVIDLVTEMDHQSETLLLNEIRSQFPHHQVITEESGSHAGDACCRWYIDPLDGTINYAHGLPIFCVSIAYEAEGQLRLGVVYDPSREECFTAERGRGAWLNGRPIRASATQELDQSLLVTGFPYDIRTNPENNLDNYARFALRTQAVRRLGSAALDLCYVASGRFDGYWEISIKAWDVAAGALIAAEAGAAVTNASGGEDFLSPPQTILAANPTLHAQMLQLLQSR